MVLWSGERINEKEYNIIGYIYREERVVIDPIKYTEIEDRN